MIAGLWVSGNSLVSASHLTRVIDATSPNFTWVLGTQTQALMHNKYVYPLSHFSRLLMRIPSLVPFLNYKIPEGSMYLLLSSSFSWSSLYFRFSPSVSIFHGKQLSPCFFLVSKLTETWIDFHTAYVNPVHFPEDPDKTCLNVDLTPFHLPLVWDPCSPDVQTLKYLASY